MKPNKDGLIEEGLITPDDEEGTAPAASSAEPQKEPEKAPEIAPPSGQGGNTDHEDNLPFHKHPRWKALVEENKTFKAKAEEFDTLKAEIERLKGSVPTQPAAIPDWFQKLYGDNQEAWEIYSAQQNERETHILEKAKAEILAEQRREKEQQAYWGKWIDEQVASLEDEGLQFDRNKLLKIVDQYHPTDEKGNFDFRRAYEIYKVLETQDKAKEAPKNDARKSLASQTLDTRPVETKEKTVATPKDVRGKSWTGLLK